MICFYMVMCCLPQVPYLTPPTHGYTHIVQFLLLCTFQFILCITKTLYRISIQFILIQINRYLLCFNTFEPVYHCLRVPHVFGFNAKRFQSIFIRISTKGTITDSFVMKRRIKFYTMRQRKCQLLLFNVHNTSSKRKVRLYGQSRDDTSCVCKNKKNEILPSYSVVYTKCMRIFIIILG